MNPIPHKFSDRMIEMYGAQGRDWVANLPTTLDTFAQRWSLTLGAHFTLSYNYVVPAARADGTEAVLKLGVPNRELLSEIHALRLYNGSGIAQLLEADFKRQVFLIERIRPGVELATLEDDDQRTRIAAKVMQRLWVPVVGDHPLLTVESWTEGLKKLRPYYGGTTGPFPAALVDTAEGIFAEFIPSQGDRVLLHGDLHHWNILAGTRQPWLALDPKGVIGEREYEVGALLRNPDLEVFNRTDLKRLQERRVAILSEMLGFERKRILGWGVAQAVLSAWWSVEDHGHFGQTSMLCAEVLFDLWNDQ
jgi:streptomycin 6-kinase